MERPYSLSPEGEKFPLPDQNDYSRERERLQALAAEHRQRSGRLWSFLKHTFGFEDEIFRITPLAIDINDTRALHLAQLVRDALRNMNRPLAAAEVLVLGASYREDVGDTCYSGSELIVYKLAEMGARMGVHEPYVLRWWEFEKQDTYPRPGYSWARFFRNQDKLKNLRVSQNLRASFRDIDAFVFAVRHKPYLALDPDELVEWAGRPFALIDCFGILDDRRIRRYFELGCEVKDLGRGHVRRIKVSVREARGLLI